MSTLTVGTLLPWTLIILVATIIIARNRVAHFQRKDWVMIIVGSIILTALSLLNQTKNLGGTQSITNYGWPHDFFHRTVSFNQAIQPEYYFWLGAFGIYLICDILFYFTILVIVFSLKKKPLPERRNTSDNSEYTK